jgi:UDP-N-acetylmuramoyl-tripeptide--D-alanyl-D-alanine ligase
MELGQAIFVRFLRLTARLQLLKIAPRYIIGITGSAGKTSCKEAVIAVLKDRFKVKEGKVGFNSELGLPMDILDLNFDYSSGVSLFLKSLLIIPWKLLFDWRKYDVMVFEMGIDSPKAPGNMNTLLEVVRPNIGILLNVLPVHTAYFQLTGEESEGELVRNIAEEKGKLIESLPDKGWAILNADDPNSLMFKKRTRAKTITFGVSNTSDVKGFTFTTDKYFFNEDYKYTFAAAIAVGKALGISEDQSKNSLKKNLILPPGRMSLFEGINGSRIIDSSYNSSRIPVMSALKTLEELPGGRKIAVLGDMRELGELAKQEHKLVAHEAVRKADYIFTFGPLMEAFFAPEAKKYLGQKGVKTKEVQVFKKMNELISFMKEFIKKGDVILVKGSQNTIFLERLVEALLFHPDDSRRLCRRGVMWERKRAASD